MTPEDIRPGWTRCKRVQERLAKHIRDGHLFVTVLAHEALFGIVKEHDNPPYVQFAWRDDVRLQIETQGDQFRDAPYNKWQIRTLDRMGYAAPFALGEEFSNRTILRDGEGSQPESAARLMIDTLMCVHGVHFHDYAMSARHGVSHWALEWRVNPSKIDLEAAFRERYTLN